MTAKTHIIGIGTDGLTGLSPHSREQLQAADVIMGADEVLQLVSNIKTEKLPIPSQMSESVKLLTERVERGQKVVLLATGDPLFYGVARYLCDRLGKENFEVHPHVSSMQMAFARVKESWEEAYLVSLASHSLESVMDRIRTAETIGIFPTEQDDPPRIARQLLAHGIDYYQIFVCENLGAPDERVTQGELREIASMEFSPLNVVILKRLPDRPDRPAYSAGLLRFGNPDRIFEQSRPVSGLITQTEVRSLALSEMQLHPGDVVWDVGAGTGSVAIESARLVEPGQVYAIEQDVVDHQLISSNAESFGVRNLRPILGTAPSVFDSLTIPDAIFVGGLSKEVGRLLSAAYEKLRPGGRLVVHLATLESLSAAHETLKEVSSNPVKVLMINLARGMEQLNTLRFEAVNPTFLLSLVKSSS